MSGLSTTDKFQTRSHSPEIIELKYQLTLKMFFGYILAMFLNINEVHSQKPVITIDCEHIFDSPAIFTDSQLPSKKFTITNSYNSSVFINSTCCDDFHPNDTDCGSCSDSREMTCFMQQDKVIDLHTDVNSTCLNETIYRFKCHEKLCNGSCTPICSTACDNKTNRRQICQSNGSWKEESCLEMATSGFNPGIITTEIYKANTRVKVISTELPAHLSDTSQSVTVQLSTSQDSHTETTNPVTTWTTDNDASTVPFVEKQDIRHDWVNFLIALGVVLAVVIIIVCGFFIRKRKKGFEKDDFSLEYWHETEYIDSICGKASCTINPMPNESGQIQPSQRYIRKDDLCNTSSYVNQGFEKGASDIPRRMKHDYTDKYVTTATGSNFYSYRSSPDVDLADSRSNLSPPRIPRAKLDVGGDKTSSFKPKYTKKQQKGRKGQLEEKSSNSAVDNDEIYAVSYKNKLQRELNDWSAEESDV